MSVFLLWRILAGFPAGVTRQRPIAGKVPKTLKSVSISAQNCHLETKTPRPEPGRKAVITKGVQAVSVSVEEKNIAWLTADCTWLSV